MTEANFWARARDHLSPFGKLVRVENPADPGTPDVCYLMRRYPTVPPVTGWLENKHVPDWPKRTATALIIDKLTREQVNWATAWACAGGRVFALLQVGRSVLLLDHRTLAQVFAREHTQTSLRAGALVVADGRFPTAEVVKCLTA